MHPLSSRISIGGVLDSMEDASCRSAGLLAGHLRT